MPGFVVVLRHASAVVVRFSELILRDIIALCGGLFIPAAGRLIIPRHVVAPFVQSAQIALGLGNALFRELPQHVVDAVPRLAVFLRGGIVIPAGSLRIAFRHASAAVVHDAEAEVRVRIPQRGGFFVPLPGPVVILRHASGVLIHDAELVVRKGMPQRGRVFIPLAGFVVVLRHAFAVVVHDAEFIPGLGIVQRGRFFVPPAGGIAVPRHACAPSVQDCQTALRRDDILFRELLQKAQTFFMPLRGGLCVFAAGPGVVLRHAFAEAVLLAALIQVPYVHVVELLLRGPQALCGSFFVPLAGLVVILRHAFAAVIHDAEAVLRLGMPQRGGFFVPFPGLVVVPQHVFAEVIFISEPVAVLRVVAV